MILYRSGQTKIKCLYRRRTMLNLSCLMPKNSFLLLVIIIRLQMRLKWCSLVTIILLNKLCKFHKLLYHTELNFCNNPKSSKNPHWLFIERTRLMLKSWLA